MIFYRDVDCCGLITNGLRGEDGRVLEKPEGFLKTLKRRGLFLKGHKKGVPLYSNLVNLKSNTMKNTMQSYDFYLNLQIYSA